MNPCSIRANCSLRVSPRDQCPPHVAKELLTAHDGVPLKLQGAQKLATGDAELHGPHTWKHCPITKACILARNTVYVTSSKMRTHLRGSEMTCVENCPSEGTRRRRASAWRRLCCAGDTRECEANECYSTRSFDHGARQKSYGECHRPSCQQTSWSGANA
jgi:hypothetical protein